VPPYADLSPHTVLDALHALGRQGDGRLLQLNSYENRVFLAYLDDGEAVVAKFYRPGRWSDAQILEEHAFALELAEAEVPVVPPSFLPADVPGVLGVPPTLFALPGCGHRVALAPRCGGREADLNDTVLRTIGRFLGRLHSVGARGRFEHRHRMAPGDADTAVAALLKGGFVTPAEQPAWESLARQAAAQIHEAFECHPPQRWLRLHGDCHLGNVLWRDATPHLVDLDDACTGPAVQDLWMLVAGDATTQAGQLAALLEGYESFFEFDRGELALIEPLRTLRMLRHSAWLAARWGDPSFPIAFPFFGSASYWSQQTTQLREQIEAMGGNA